MTDGASDPSSSPAVTGPKSTEPDAVTPGSPGGGPPGIDLAISWLQRSLDQLTVATRRTAALAGSPTVSSPVLDAGTGPAHATESPGGPTPGESSTTAPAMATIAQPGDPTTPPTPGGTTARPTPLLD